MLLLFHEVAIAGDWYVATNGTAGGDGSIGSPWNLATALTNPVTVVPGDTIWMRGGTYHGSFISKLTGTSSSPITLRQYPSERAIIDQAGYTNSNANMGCLEVDTPYGWYRDFEVMSSNTNRYDQPGKGYMGVYVVAQGCKFINMIVHDNTAGGFLSGQPGTNTEFSGCIVYYNGYQLTDHGHGHGFYLQGNNPLFKYSYGNISFANFAIGSKFYAETPPIDGAKYVGNTFFNGGIIASNNTLNVDYDLQVGGLSNTRNVTILSNYTWHANIPNFYSDSVGICYGQETNSDLVVSNNFFAGGLMSCKWWSNGIVMGNTILAESWQVANGLSGNAPYQMDYNTYYFPSAYLGGNGRAAWIPCAFWLTNVADYTNLITLSEWTNTTTYDYHSSFTISSNAGAAYPQSVSIYVVPNAYDQGRANITVFNWPSNDTVNVDVSSVLPAGWNYVVKNVQDWFGTNVTSGTYTGGNLTLPTHGLSVAAPIGTIDGVNPIAAPPETGPQFVVFELMGSQANTATATTGHAGTLRSPP